MGWVESAPLAKQEILLKFHMRFQNFWSKQNPVGDTCTAASAGVEE